MIAVPRSVASLVGLMKSKAKWTVTYVALAIICLSLLAMFVLDWSYANNPQAPDPQIGRVFERGMKHHGPVYLTASEYAPYKWLYIAILCSCGVVVVVQGFDLVQQKIRGS